MNIGIVGSRNFNNYDMLKAAVLKVLEEWIIKVQDVENIVSGGANGVDKLVEKFSDEFKINKILFPVTKEEWNTYGKAAGPRRNIKIVNASTHLISFPSRNGSGTQSTISLAEKKGIPVKILFVD